MTNVNTSPKLSRRVSRQASLETDTPTLYGACAGHAPRRQQARGPQEQLYYQELRRRYGRQSSSEGSGRGETGHEKRRPVDCNKVRSKKLINLINRKIVIYLDLHRYYYWQWGNSVRPELPEERRGDPCPQHGGAARLCEPGEIRGARDPVSRLSCG